MTFTLLVVGIAALLLVTSNTFIDEITLQIHSNNFINGLAKYQIFALIVGILATTVTLLLTKKQTIYNTKKMKIQ